MSQLEDVLSKLVLLKRVTDGGLGAKPPAMEWGYGLLRRLWVPGGEASSSWVIFCNSLEKICFDAIGSHFARGQIVLKELDV